MQSLVCTHRRSGVRDEAGAWTWVCSGELSIVMEQEKELDYG